MNIVLAGNPNVGKSVIFNALTGKYVTVSNYPGTTVEVARGPAKFGGREFTIIDTPGVNSLSAHSEDEKVTSQILAKSDVGVIVQVADSKNLKRSLVLTLELLELGLPLVLDLNMADEAKERGMRIDRKKLSEDLGIEVVETVAVTGEGIARLREAILKARIPRPSAAVSTVTSEEKKRLSEIFLLRRRGLAADRIAHTATRPSQSAKKRISELIGNLMIRPLTGLPILALVLVFMYLFVGKFAAGTAVDFFEHTVFGKFINPHIIWAADRFIPVQFIKDFLVGEYGMITMAFTYAFAIIFPIVIAFFLFFGILEDSGYLPRLSVLSDRLFKAIGLNGRAILPIILGFGCGTMATLTARILETKRERIIVTLLLALAIPCSAQLGVVMGMLSSLSAKAFLWWLGTLIFVLVATGLVASRIVPGTSAPFIQEIPPVRLPAVGNVIAKTFARLKWYLKEAVPLFVLGTAILFVLDKLHLLAAIEKFFSPLVVNFLSLPSKATEAFIIGFLRRDYGAAGLYMLSRSGQLDTIQALTSLIVITLFVPCIAQFLVAVKERGMKIALLIGAFVFFTAFLVGGAINFILRYMISKGMSPV